MYNLDREGILELEDFTGKKVLCLMPEKELLVGLLKRGASVWHQQDTLAHLQKYLDSALVDYPLAFWEPDDDVQFDYMVVDGADRYQIDLMKRSLADSNIIILKSSLLTCYRLSKIRSNCLNGRFDVYSIVTSFESVRIIYPEGFGLGITRFWSLRNSDLLLMLKMVVSWFISSNSYLRRCLIDKIVVCDG